MYYQYLIWIDIVTKIDLLWRRHIPVLATCITVFAVLLFIFSYQLYCIYLQFFLNVLPHSMFVYNYTLNS